MLTYILFKIQSMFMSGKSRKGQPDVDLHPVQDSGHAHVRKSRKGQPDADLHPVQNSGHAHVSKKQEGPGRCCLTLCL
jgi:hypothetical protein